MIILERRGKLLGILPQIKNKMLLETTPPKDDKYEAQGYWVGNKAYASRFCKNAKDCELWTTKPGRQVVGFPNYTRFRALTKPQSLALKSKLKVYSSEIEKEKKVKSYYEKKNSI